MMAGLISYLSSSPAVMGIFATLTGIGRNLAPLVAAPVVDRFAAKRRILLIFWAGVVASWLALTLFLWTPAASNRSLGLIVFGFCYCLFFLLLGAVTVAQGALLGKIIPADMRGRAMAAGMSISGLVNVVAILLVYRLVQGGGFPEPRNYALAFSVTVGCFLLAGGALLAVKETPSATRRSSLNLLSNVRRFIALARTNENLGRLMIIHLTVGLLAGMLQFYTAYWRRAGGLDAGMAPGAIMLATVVQVVWQSGSAAVFGRMADTRGNRWAINWLVWMDALIPLFAILLGGLPPFNNDWRWFLLIYALVGMRFPLYQILVNYLLEVTPEAEHATALGAATSVQILTAPAPILLGLVAAGWGYAAAFALAALAGALGASAAIGLREVRVTARPVQL